MSEAYGYKKLLLRVAIVITLLLILVAISVIKTNVSARREELNLKSLELKYKTTIDSLLMATKTTSDDSEDSLVERDLLRQTQLNLLLLNQLQDSTRFYGDSIKKIEDYYQAVIDSINTVYSAVNTKGQTIAGGNITLSGSDMVKLVTEYDSLVADIPAKTPPRERMKAIEQLTSRLTKKYTSSSGPSKK